MTEPERSTPVAPGAARGSAEHHWRTRASSGEPTVAECLVCGCPRESPDADQPCPGPRSMTGTPDGAGTT